MEPKRRRSAVFWTLLVAGELAVAGLLCYAPSSGLGWARYVDRHSAQGWLVLLLLVLATTFGFLFSRINPEVSKRERTVWLVVFATVAAFVAACVYVAERDVREKRERIEREMPKDALEDSFGGLRRTPEVTSPLAILASVSTVLVLGALLFALLLRWFLVLQRRERERRDAEARRADPP